MHIRYISFILFFILGLLIAPVSNAQPKYEIRATWVTTLGGLDWPSRKAMSPSSVERQKKEFCELLDRLKQAHFNTVLFQTRVRGDVVYPSVFEPFTESLTGHEGKNPGYDPLRFAIDECHKRGMELHAWIVTIPIGNMRQIKIMGKSSIVKKRPSICKKYKDTWYLDPGNPGTDEYLTSIVKEIVSNYDVDGVHFDYIRYPEHSEKFPDQNTFRKYGKGQDIAQWRRDNITRIARRLYSETKKLKPWVKVSSSPVGKYNDTGRYTSRGWNAYTVVYQDAQKWLEEGIQDALFPMMYFQGNNFYPFALDWKENSNGRWIIPGLGIYFLHPEQMDWNLDEIVRQIYFIRESGLNGQAYFRNKFLLDNTKGLLDQLSEQFYTAPAVVPPMTWIDSIAPSVPSNPTFSPLEKGVNLSWMPSTDNQQAPVYYRIYASNTYPVDTENPKNIIETRVNENRYTFTPQYPWDERIYWVVTAVDRCGNESRALEMNQPLQKRK
ncbi:family 10 glycosylhydrolase [uncultured Bacteroides sp.]|uniref:glycoside hydrolase family 10 protein n=1 Tax=uncultured Bacteroides sp. TaxID=162156 RepID=UPI00261CB2DB|nr:family 10 glycosylhydrolase [uncultured Bacteroides sp.]